MGKNRAGQQKALSKKTQSQLEQGTLGGHRGASVSPPDYGIDIVDGKSIDGVPFSKRGGVPPPPCVHASSPEPARVDASSAPATCVHASSPEPARVDASFAPATRVHASSPSATCVHAPSG